MAHSVHVDVRGLEPQREYFYRFHCGPAVSRIGRAFTLPPPDASVGRLRFAYASCSHLEQGYFTTYRDLIAQNPAFIIHLGDYIYEASWGSPVRHHPGPEPHDLDAYRLYHAAYKLDPDLQAAHAHCPWFFTWDDHEAANDYTANEAPATLDPKAFMRCKMAAYKAYYERMPLRPSAAFDGTGLALYQRFLFGDLAEFNITDGRQYRAALPCQTPNWRQGWIMDVASCVELNDPARSMLGPVQEQWLDRGYGRASAHWNVFSQGQMFASSDQIPSKLYGVFTDSWGGYPASRRRILDLVEDRKLTNVIAIAGDIHSFFASDIKDDSRNPDSATLMSEIVGTSVTSESFNTALFNPLLPENPHIKFLDDCQRGYVLCDATKDTWRADLRAVDNVRVRNGTVSTLRTFVVENGKPGVLPG